VTLGAEGALLSAAVVGLFLSAPVALAHRRGGYAVALGASILLLVAAILELAFGRIEGLAWTGPLGDPEGIGLDGLSAFFALAASVVWIATSSYSIFYDDRGSTLLAFCYGLTLAAIALLVSASSFLLFLIGWEVMTLASYGMILQARGRTDRVFSAAFVFLAFGEGSTLLVVIAVAALRAGSGTFELGATGLGGTLASLAFVTALLGFGLKMGVAPFHLSEWLPIAHSSAPSNASAVLSSTLTLAGAYGLFRVVSSLGPPEVWWGGLTLAIGAISVLLGALFASVSEHTKGLPAYSTIENNGLVLVALGTALVAESYGLTELAVFALFAAFYQAIAHAVAKTALFLSAGYVEHAAHTFDLTGVAGAVKGSDPGESSGTLVAALSLAAAPPLAGFVSEWMVLEALFQSYRFSTPGAQLLGLLAGAAVALAAGLIAVAMVKFVGFAILWKPRDRPSATRAAGLGTVVGLVGAVVVGLGVGAPWLLRALAPCVSAFSGHAVGVPVGALLSVPSGWSILSGSPFGILSPPMVPIGLAAGAVVALGYYALGGSRGVRSVPTWMAGSESARTGETYTSFGYSTGIRIMLRSILRTREVRATVGSVTQAGLATPEPYNVDLEVLDVFKLFYDDLVAAAAAISEALKSALMPGRLGQYLAYLLVVVLVVVIYIALAV